MPSDKTNAVLTLSNAEQLYRGAFLSNVGSMIVNVNTVLNSFSGSEVCGLSSSSGTAVKSASPSFLFQMTVSGIGFPVTMQETLTGSSSVVSIFGVLSVTASGSKCGKQKQGKLKHL